MKTLAAQELLFCPEYHNGALEMALLRVHC